MFSCLQGGCFCIWSYPLFEVGEIGGKIGKDFREYQGKASYMGGGRVNQKCNRACRMVGLAKHLIILGVHAF